MRDKKGKKKNLNIYFFWVGLFVVVFSGGFTPTTFSAEFIAVLNGKNVVPMIETPASGQATFKIDQQKKELHFKLRLNEIENVVSAHIHLGKPGENGPKVAVLAGPFPPGGGRIISAVVAEGIITGADLIGPLESYFQEDSERHLASFVVAIKSGRAYVNVHTEIGEDLTMTQPGNFPDGEIRGPILPI